MPIILFSTSNRWLLISFAIPDRLQRYALQDKMQLIGGQLQALCIQVKGWYFKRPLLQPSVKDREAALLIHQQLQVRTRPVNEDESISLRDLSAQLIDDNATKLVKPFAHIGLFPVEMIRPVRTQQQYAAHDASSLR
jgi:hypothetical protein